MNDYGRTHFIKGIIRKRIKTGNFRRWSGDKKAEQHAHETGKLNPLVDPAGYGVIRRSLPRFTEKDGHFILNVGTPMPIETRIDTTGSMGNNIDICLRVMKKSFRAVRSRLTPVMTSKSPPEFSAMCRIDLCFAARNLKWNRKKSSSN